MITIDEKDLQEVGFNSNVKAVIQGDTLILMVDMTVDQGLSSTGKMRAIGNTGGFQNLPSGLRGNIYIGKKA